MAAYFASLNPAALLRGCPGGIAQGLIWGVMALGVFLTFRMLDFADLSVDGTFATGGAICIVLITAGVNPQLALIIAFVGGCLAGTLTGLLHTMLGIPAILSGILTQSALYSINLHIMGKPNQAVPAKNVTLYITSNIKVLNRTILICAVICLVVITLIYWYLGTEQGSAIRATGSNPNMSRAAGISTNLMKVICLALSNGVVAFSGALLSQYQGFADIKMGQGAIVIGLAAVVIGEVIGHALIGKRMNFYLRLCFVVVGGIIYYLVYVFVLWLKIAPEDMKLLSAAVVAVFLATPNLKANSKSSFRRLAKENAKAKKGGM